MRYVPEVEASLLGFCKQLHWDDVRFQHLLI